MNMASDARPVAAGDTQSASNSAFYWHHPAFCLVGLPVRVAKGGWRRDLADVSVVIESALAPDPAAAGKPDPAGGKDAIPPIPTGKFLRLLLMHIFSEAVAAESAAVELGEGLNELAARIDPELKGVKLRDLGEQLDRLLAAKITVSLDGGPTLSVFDARGRAKAGSASRATADWRASVRLNGRFFASLAANPVKLDRRVVAALADLSMALDAYSWLAYALPRLGGGEPIVLTWEELLARFGSASQQVDEFRAAFEQGLQQVSAECPEISLVIREQGVEFRQALPRRARAAEPVIAEPVIAEAGAAAVAEPVDAIEASIIDALMQEAPVAGTATDEADELARELAAQMPLVPPAAPAPSHAPVDPPVSAAPIPPTPILPTPVRRDPGRPVPVRQAPEAPPAAEGDQRQRLRQSVSLKPQQTGLSQVIWLQRANGRENLVIEVTPGGRYDPANLTVLTLEPMILQVSGGLYDHDFERVAAWANANRDLIDDFWEGQIDTFEEINARVKPVPAPGWR